MTHALPHRHPWAARELVVLGTAAQSPTPTRNHNGYALRWGPELVLFDPGEGAQRQLARAGISVAQITRICITHAHGDHCLGLPGVLQRRSLDPQPAPIELYFPTTMAPQIDALLSSSLWERDLLAIGLHPLDDRDTADWCAGITLRARALDHTADTLGWRLDDPPARHFDTARLAALGVADDDIGRLRRDGTLTHRGGVVSLDDVSRVEAGHAFAFVMDTRPCAAAFELARDTDLAVFESTYLDAAADLAHAHGHSTARQSAQCAARAGVRRLVLSHYSERYRDETAFADEARTEHHDVVAARDLDTIRAPSTDR